ncbi:hypothetical protein GCM10023213_23820 [Prosthecobacter algae]|uniref:Uncharacterized protein n=1 Tax=Prosthecobacter algae TaxID=1144682 RepID=A0ABP9P4N9_9BACT
MVERLFEGTGSRRGNWEWALCVGVVCRGWVGAGKGTRMRDWGLGNLPRLRRVWAGMPDDGEPLAWGLGMGLEYCPAIPPPVQVPGTPTWAKWRKSLGSELSGSVTRSRAGPVSGYRK